MLESTLNNEDPSITDSAALDVDTRIVGKSYNDQSHKIVNKFIRGTEHKSNPFKNRARTYSILSVNKKWLSIGNTEDTLKHNNYGVGDLFSSGKSWSIQERYKGKIIKNKAWSFHLIRSEKTPKSRPKIDSNYIGELSQDMIVRFSPEMLKQWLKISKASK